MTDNEIIKALECMLGLCNNDMAYVLDCRGCAFEGNPPCDERCSDGIAKAALSLINRQKAENERLKDALIDNEYANCVAVKGGLIYTHTLGDYDKLIGDISAEAIKEFAERLKEALYRTEFGTPVVDVEDIDNLVKEMVGDDDG